MMGETGADQPFVEVSDGKCEIVGGAELHKDIHERLQRVVFESDVPTLFLF